MEKPPFQFGLKAVFVVMTGAAIVMAIGLKLPAFLLISLAASAAFTLVYMVLAIAIALGFEQATFHAARLCRWVQTKPPDA
jgi:hypothetical protein